MNQATLLFSAVMMAYSFNCQAESESFTLKISGTASFSEPMALPHQSQLHLKLYNAALPLDTVAETIFPISNQPPYPFEFNVDRYNLDSSQDYQLSACIHDNTQQKIWQTLVNPTVFAKGKKMKFMRLKLRKVLTPNKLHSSLPAYFSLRQP